MSQNNGASSDLSSRFAGLELDDLSPAAPFIPDSRPTYDVSHPPIFGASIPAKPTAFPVATASTPKYAPLPDNVPAPPPNWTPVMGGAAYRDKNGVWYNRLGFVSGEKQGLKHVSLEWLKNNCIPFPGFLEQLQADAKKKRDLRTPESAVRLDENLRLPDGTPLTGAALRSLTDFTEMPAAMVRYLLDREEKSDLARYINTELDDREIAWARGKRGPRDFTLRKRDARPGEESAKDGNIVRHVASGTYGCYGNHELIEDVFAAFEDKGIAGAYASHITDTGDRINVNLLLPDDMVEVVRTPETDIGVMFSFSNSELGDGAVYMDPSTYEAICRNGCIWGKNDAFERLVIRHVQGRINRYQIRKDIRRVGAIALGQGIQLAGQLKQSREVKVDGGKARVGQVIVSAGKSLRLTGDQMNAWAKGYNVEGGDNAFGVVRGLTRAAQEYSGDTRRGMEKAAAELLTPALDADLSTLNRYWGERLASARLLEEKVVKQTLTVAIR